MTELDVRSEGGVDDAATMLSITTEQLTGERNGVRFTWRWKDDSYDEDYSLLCFRRTDGFHADAYDLEANGQRIIENDERVGFYDEVVSLKDGIEAGKTYYYTFLLEKQSRFTEKLLEAGFGLLGNVIKDYTSEKSKALRSVGRQERELKKKIDAIVKRPWWRSWLPISERKLQEKANLEAELSGLALKRKEIEAWPEEKPDEPSKPTERRSRPKSAGKVFHYLVKRLTVRIPEEADQARSHAAPKGKDELLIAEKKRWGASQKRLRAAGIDENSEEWKLLRNDHQNRLRRITG